LGSILLMMNYQNREKGGESMKVLLTGGGTGGHITPLLAVAESLKRKQPDCEIRYIGEYGAKFAHLTDASRAIDSTSRVCAGKFRRYHGVSLLERVFDFRTLFLNVRDAFLVCIGTVQAIVLLGRYRPDVIFLKGGYVGVPVGLAGALWRIPMVTHDSDAIPGLANRLAGRWATLHAVAAHPETYPYPAARTVQVGVLVEQAYQPMNEAGQKEYKQSIGIPTDALVLLVTGGSLGAVAINEAIALGCRQLLDDYPNMWIVHQVGKGKTGVYGTYQHPRLKVMEFLKPMATYTGAADLVVCRGSANTIAELGVQGRAAIVIPSPYLANGHQLRNAEVLDKAQSAVVVAQDMLYDTQQGLDVQIRSLLDDSKMRKVLGRRLQRLYKTGAAEKVADLLVEAAHQKQDGA
jgi:UDP-N-acetylglucosamine--N-acetylmuramyl-(pentapeptide) pyrophosphoryl-undecaprenol N-acetylglucosamine transferase